MFRKIKDKNDSHNDAKNTKLRKKNHIEDVIQLLAPGDRRRLQSNRQVNLGAHNTFSSPKWANVALSQYQSNRCIPWGASTLLAILILKSVVSSGAFTILD